MLAIATVTAGSRSGGRALALAARGRIMLAPSLAAVKSAAGATASSRSARLHNCMYSTSTPTSYSFDRSSGPSFSFGGPNSSSGGSSAGGGGDGTGAFEMSRWPIRKSNTILNIVPQGQRFIVERFGKLSAIHDSGYFFAVPFVDHIGELVRSLCCTVLF